ncbi:TPA: hypothetical protein P0E24_004968 [Vibrio campbellii]|nr:hypothetical protein [Vibrio campbellii]
MSNYDWYRNKVWNDEIETQFYLKLKRSRSQRDQYLVIQALTLTETNPKVTLRLVQEYFETRKNTFDDVRALLARTYAYITLSDIERVVRSYRELLACEMKLPNHTTGAYVDYPFFVATKGIEQEYANAVCVLRKNSDRPVFPLEFFKWHAAMALINQERNHAISALEAAKVNRSGFRFHQDVGLVGKEHTETIKQLCELST